MKLAYIDALRGLAILSVIWFHCHLYHFSDTTFYSLMDTLGSPAAMGVQLFYVLSAFTLFLSQQKRNTGETGATSFFRRRYVRIAPLYYVAIIYYICQLAYTQHLSVTTFVERNTTNILANVFLIHGLNSVWINSIIPGGWSVGVEVLFYALVPYLFTRITSLNRAVLFTSCALLFGFCLTALLINISIPGLQANYLYYYLPFQLPVFGCGIIAYFLIVRNDYRIKPYTGIIALSVLAFVVVSKQLGHHIGLELPHTLHFYGSIGFILLLVGLAKRPVWLLVNRATEYVGKVSYSAYLTHFGVLFWMNQVMPREFIPVENLTTNVINFHLKFLLIVLVTVCVSTITYQLIEKPALQLGKRRQRKQETPQPVLIDHTDTTSVAA
ncbi:acyltransferase family protein [Spirosoma sp. KUDC1026]|uniref:acyltransferase family protein n=1 Tax=Spirosoma sp. KUDC1026 TaxID=2745947 RepID=UPI00159B8B5A|nr:acyltransferase [Spirosoma sp. KUDC1026]QKZ13029.1 acyltransferase [Spirosoma sp. KUDC1026]